MRTDGNGLDLDTLLDVGGSRVVGLLVSKHGLAAQGINEGGTAWTGIVGGQSKRNPPTKQYRRRRDSPVPEAPQTIRQNWMPFLTFFFRRIIFCPVNMLAPQTEGFLCVVAVIDWCCW